MFALAATSVVGLVGDPARVRAQAAGSKSAKAATTGTPDTQRLTAKRASPLPEQTMSGSLAGQYCDAIRDAAGEARFAVQAAHLESLVQKIEDRMAHMESKSAELKDWMSKRQAFMTQASDQLVGIFAAMRAEAASGLLARLDPSTAAAILSKLDPRAASAILSGMSPDKAGRLTTILASVARKSDAGTRP